MKGFTVRVDQPVELAPEQVHKVFQHYLSQLIGDYFLSGESLYKRFGHGVDDVDLIGPVNDAQQMTDYRPLLVYFAVRELTKHHCPNREVGEDHRMRKVVGALPGYQDDGYRCLDCGKFQRSS